MLRANLPVQYEGQTLDKCAEAADKVLEQARAFDSRSYALTSTSVTPPNPTVNSASTTTQHNAPGNNSSIQMACQEVRRLMQVVEQHETTIISLRP
ncbi:unnamed protein product [Fasciola hepatica]|uniref:Uncharacterized protein n=1 Tax=Fasciola hepatica TaxID=6192 RepID=A0ABC9HIA2_FASHE|nr:unnamed protein product [Fasciola hepatica]